MSLREIIIKKSTLFLGGFLMLISFHGIAQNRIDSLLLSWDKNVLKQANTADTFSNLSDDEKKFIFYTNLCRLQPRLFGQTVLASYLKTHTGKPVQVKSLQKELDENKSCQALVPDKELDSIAQNFAQKMGSAGKIGHADFESRMKPIMTRYKIVGENCDYGHEFYLDAFINLLIDSSDPTLGHRKNILNGRFAAIGVSRQMHKTYHWSFVIDFAGQ